MRSLARALLFAVPTVVMGCGHASVLEQRYEPGPGGGVLVLHGHEGRAFEDAQNKMAAHCGLGKYKIQQRAQVVVGNEAYTTSQTSYAEDEAARKGAVSASATSRSSRRSATVTAEGERRQVQGGSTTTQVSGVREVRETRITYKCLR